MIRVLLDQNVWRDITRLPDKPVILEAFYWGSTILFFWKVEFLGKSPKDDLHFDKVAYTKPILDAWSKDKLDVVTTKIAESEMSRQQALHRMDIGWSPTILDPKTNIISTLFERKLIPETTSIFVWYDGNGKQKIKFRNIYIENYENPKWQKFKQETKVTKKDLTDSFIFWQSSIYNVDYIVTADLKFVDKSKKWKKLLEGSPMVCTPKELVDELKLGEPDPTWTTKRRSVLHQRSFDAGYIPNVSGKIWFLKALLKQDLGYIPPKEEGHTPRRNHRLKALFNMKLGKQIFKAKNFNVK